MIIHLLNQWRRHIKVEHERLCEDEEMMKGSLNSHEGKEGENRREPHAFKENGLLIGQDVIGKSNEASTLQVRARLMGHGTTGGFPANLSIESMESIESLSGHAASLWPTRLWLSRGCHQRRKHVGHEPLVAHI